MAITLSDLIYGLEITRRAELEALERTVKSGDTVATATHRERFSGATKRLEEAVSKVGPIPSCSEAASAFISNSMKLF